MNTLQSFVDRFNSKESADLFLTALKADYTESLEKRTHTGVSELGKPAIITAVKRLHPDLELDPPLKAKLRMHFGNLMEQAMIQIMKHYGDVSLEQSEVEFNGILGHIDGVWEGRIVFDIKMMSSGYYDWFTKKPNDNRGYLTQIACYSACLNLDPAMLCINSDTFELSLVKFDPNFLEGYVERAILVSDALHKITDWDTLLESGIVAPMPEPEIYKKEPTGNYLVPTTMKYTALKPCCYETELGINNRKEEVEYVVGLRDMGMLEHYVTEMLNARIPF